MYEALLRRFWQVVDSQGIGKMGPQEVGVGGGEPGSGRRGPNDMNFFMVTQDTL